MKQQWQSTQHQKTKHRHRGSRILKSWNYRTRDNQWHQHHSGNEHCTTRHKRSRRHWWFGRQFTQHRYNLRPCPTNKKTQISMKQTDKKAPTIKINSIPYTKTPEHVIVTDEISEKRQWCNAERTAAITYITSSTANNEGLLVWGQEKCLKIPYAPKRKKGQNH